MATIYRFIVEQGKSGKSGGRNSGDESTKKTGKTFTALQLLGTGEKGGVEHNRKLRAINPLLNKITYGYWEKGMRVGRAGLGLLKFRKTDTGGLEFAGLSATAIAILIAFTIQTYLKIQQYYIKIAEQQNKANYKSLENGVSSIHGQYETSVNVWNGKITYNQNK